MCQRTVHHTHTQSHNTLQKQISRNRSHQLLQSQIHSSLGSSQIYSAKYICYVRSCILEEINISQKVATVLSIDNQGAVLMVDAQQPTRKTQHIDIKHLKIQEWVE